MVAWRAGRARAGDVGFALLAVALMSCTVPVGGLGRLIDIGLTGGQNDNQCVPGTDLVLSEVLSGVASEKPSATASVWPIDPGSADGVSREFESLWRWLRNPQDLAAPAPPSAAAGHAPPARGTLAHAGPDSWEIWEISEDSGRWWEMVGDSGDGGRWREM